MHKFKSLCNQFKINPDHLTPESVDKLVEWYETTVSTENHFNGNLNDRFNFYTKLAVEFLENIEPKIQANKLTTPEFAFNGLSSLQFLVDKGFDSYLKKLKPTPEQINTPINGYTLLQLAAARGNLNTTEVLLALGAKHEPNMATLFSTLMLPISHDEKMIQNKQAIYKLLSKGQKFENIVNEKNESGSTILHIMAIYGYAQLIKETLTKTKGLAAVANNMGHYPIISAIFNGQHECVKVLIDVEGVAQLTDNKGRNALHYAARYGDADMVKTCLTKISKNLVDALEKTPLILAVIGNNSKTVQELLDAGADINKKDNGHKSALHYAVEANNLAIVKLLLASPNIDVNSVDYQSHHPLDLANLKGPSGAEICNLLIEKGATYASSSGLQPK